MKKQNCIYGYIAGIANAIALQPLDNIKMALMLAPKDLSLSNNFLTNLWRVSDYLWKQQKIEGFYKGLVPNLMKTGVGSAIYFYTLRSMEEVLQQQNFYLSFGVSSFARAISTLVANPFSVIETRYELAAQNRWKGTILESFRKMYAIEGIQGFFKGSFASCIKEGSFAGFYYALYIEGKTLGLSTLVSGMLAGSISTVITHPFEIMRANLQSQILFYNGQQQMLRMPLMSQLVNLFRQKQLLKGVAPRLLKKPLANTTAFLLFESMEEKKE